MHCRAYMVVRGEKGENKGLFLGGTDGLLLRKTGVLAAVV